SYQRRHSIYIGGMEVVKAKWEAISHEREQENHDRDANSATLHKKETQPEFFDPFDLIGRLTGIISP
ncbi:MAG: hypothetical protein MUP52_10140, partial [Candidatus Aminicenantes bacterium]|nr:hypothetical protein [Candidatus Aminicenantes bacterium]